MATNAIYLSNLPKGITERELENQLCTITRIAHHFRPARQAGTLYVDVYDGEKGRVAVVGGISVNFDFLGIDFRGVSLMSVAAESRPKFGVAVKMDTGEKRPKDGKFYANHPSHFRLELQKYAGKTNRRIVGIFSRELLDSVPDEIFGGYRTVSYLNTFDVLQLAELQKPGYYLLKKDLNDHGHHWGFMLTYLSQMEKLQALTYLNYNENIAERPPIFSDADGYVTATCNYGRGLAVDNDPQFGPNRMLNIASLTKRVKYIPFRFIDPAFLNQQVLARISARCNKCKTSYRLLGINFNLEYLTGKCNCDYDGLDILHPNRAIYWEGEKFTRLIPIKPLLRDMQQDNNDPIIFEAVLEPLRRRYKHVLQYRRIMHPLLDQESAHSKQTLQDENIEFGKIMSAEPVESLGPNKNQPLTKQQPDGYYSISIEVPATKPAWQIGNPKVVAQVNIMKDEEISICGNVFQMESSPSSFGKTLIRAQLMTNKLTVKTLLEAEQVTIIPLPSLSECCAAKEGIETWASKSIVEGSESYLESVILGTTSRMGDWTIRSSFIKIRESWERDGRKEQFRKMLNKEQLAFLQTAEISPFSFLHGFPGTGKTFTVAVIVSYLLAREKGHIIILAPSNYACSEIGKSLTSVSNKLINSPPPNVLRVLSHCKASSGYHEDGVIFLHNLVESSKKWLDPSRLMEESPNLEIDSARKIKERVEDKRLDMLNEQQRKALDKHRKILENELMEGYDIIISTVGCLSDGRVKAWAYDKKISSIVLDESAQLSNPLTLLLSGFNPSRIIFAGDPLQLKPAVHSASAELGGLDVSVMEAVSFQALVLTEGSAPNYPWKKLLTQYRMHPSICKLVYSVTYTGLFPQEDKKFFQNACLQQQCKANWMPFMNKTFNSKRVIVFDHDGMEQVQGTAIKNEKEVEVIIAKIKLFLKNGMSPKQISIITMYDLQKKHILQALFDNNIQGVDVGNTDAIQGRENDVIILSLVRANVDGELGFLIDVHRLNVALSRARHFLIIACNFGFYKASKIQHWKTFTSLIEERGSNGIAYVEKISSN